MAKLTKQVFRSVWDGRYPKVGCARRWKSSPAPQASFILDGGHVEPAAVESTEWSLATPYDKVPGPTPMPIIGNNWRFLPVIVKILGDGPVRSLKVDEVRVICQDRRLWLFIISAYPRGKRCAGKFRIEQLDQVARYLYDNYGPCVKLAGVFGRPDILFIADPDDIEQVFRTEDHHPHRPSMPSLMYYKNVLRKDFFSKYGGVLSVQGETWSSFRTKVQQPMLQPRTAKLYVGAIEEAAMALVERARSIRDEHQEMPADFMNELNKWSLESIASIALDTRLGCLDENSPKDTQQLIDAVTRFFTNVRTLEVKIPFWKLFSTPTWRSYIEALDTIWSISLHHIEAAMRRSKEDTGTRRELSLLQRILASNTNDPHVAVVMALEMFIVGIDTVSTAVASTLYQLSLHQDVQEKLYREISTVLPTKDTPLTAARLENMHYLKACIKENFRLFPTVLINGRILSRDSVIHGYQIPKGTMVIFQNYVASNLEKNFANSSKFSPERWLKSASGGSSADEGSDGKTKTGCPHHHAFASLPFGYGKRMCLGKRFADLEMQTVICKMIQNYKIEYHHAKLNYHMKPMYIPNGPLKFKLIDRN